LRQRGRLASLWGYAAPMFMLLVALMTYTFVLTSAEVVPPLAVAISVGFVFLVVHFMLLFEVVARVGRGEGMASALYQFPLSPMLIHAAEVSQSLASPLIFLQSFAVLGMLVALGMSPFVALPWLLLSVVYLGAVHQLLQLLLRRLLRRRLLRELSIAGLSVVGLAVWLGANWVLHNADPAAFIAQLESLPGSYWLLPFNWLIGLTDFAATMQPLAPVVAGVGMSLAVLATLVVGADLQQRACFGDGGARSIARAGVSRVRRFHLADRLPLSLVSPAVWATMGKEFKMVQRDPFQWVMLISQSALLLAPPLLFGRLHGVVTQLAMPGLVMVLLMVQSAPLFNIIAIEGRSLHFLAQSPVSRWQIMVGKNLAWGLIFVVFNAAFLALGGLAYGVEGKWAIHMALSCVGLVMLLGVGNVVSVFLPTAWVGARGAEGGSRGAHAASEGGVEPTGCLTLMLRLLCLQGLLLLVLPAAFLVLLGPSLLGDAGAFLVAMAVAAYSLLVYLLSTWLAVARLAHAEEGILLRFATRGAV